MKKLFEIPVYGLSPATLELRVRNYVEKLKLQFINRDEDTFARIKDIETFPMRSWDYNHIVGYIRIEMSNTDIIFDVFLPIPMPKRYNWRTKQKARVQNICANGTHFYMSTYTTNEEIREAMERMLDQVVANHIPERFYVDREAFDTVNRNVDFIEIRNSYEEKTNGNL